MTTPTWTTHSIDTQVALRTAAARLADEFRGVYGTETIERFLASSYDHERDVALGPTALGRRGVMRTV